MIYSATAGLLFTHVSRTGGVMVTELLGQVLPDRARLGGQHDALVEARRSLGAHFDAAFKFAVVRNPWERLVSWYALLGQVPGAAAPAGEALADPDGAHWRGFDAFLDTWLEVTVVIDGVRRRQLSQWAQLADADGRLLTDDLGRFERLASDVPRLFARAGLDCPALPRLNAAPHGHYSRYYTDYGRERVADAFSEDVTGFGYRFERF